MIPIDFQHAPTPKKPRKDASSEEKAAYCKQAREQNLSIVGVRRLQMLRDELNTTDPKRRIVAVGDGGYTNRNTLRNLPTNITFIGRIRSDAKLFLPFDSTGQKGSGRNRRYGEQAPTPDQLRTNDAVTWQNINVVMSAKERSVRVKELKPVLWKTAGYQMPLRLIVIAPTGYRLRKGVKTLYRKPAYLITNDHETSLDQIVQQYIWRWDIEVNFRDEKQMFGVGQAQVRNEESVQAAPALAVAAYSMLLLSAVRAYGTHGKPTVLPPPKWQEGCEKARPSTADLRQALRYELWGRGIGDFSGFAYHPHADTKPAKYLPQLTTAALYAS